MMTKLIEKKVVAPYLIPLVISLVSIAVAAGAANARIDGAFARIEQQEQHLNPALEGLRKDVSEIKIKVAETARDVQWIREQQQSIPE